MLTPLMEHTGFVPTIVLVATALPTLLVFVVGCIMKVPLKEIIRAFVTPTLIATFIISTVASVAVFNIADDITYHTDAPRTQGVERITDIDFVRDYKTNKDILVLTLGPADNEIVYTEAVKARYPHDSISPGQYNLFDTVEYSVYQTEVIQAFGPATTGEPEVIINRIIDGPAV